MHGFHEISHPADRAIKVWATSMEMLFIQAVHGMYSVLDVKGNGILRIEKQLKLNAESYEEALVGFLGELLFDLEVNNIRYHDFHISFQECRLIADLEGMKGFFHTQEIKAVTYHNLKIEKLGETLETEITFDV